MATKISQNLDPLELQHASSAVEHHSDFLELPGELRNKIYWLTLTTALRPQYRPLISGVTIYEEAEMGRLKRGIAAIPDAEFWPVLFQCKGLRALDLAAYRYHRHDAPYATTPVIAAERAGWDRLTAELPNLKAFSWIYHTSFYEYNRIFKCFDLTVLSPEQFRQHGRFELVEDYWFGADFYESVCPVGPWRTAEGKTRFTAGGPYDHRRAAGIVGGKNTFDAADPEAVPTTWSVRVSLLPLSPEALKRNAELRERDERLRMAEEA